MPTSRRRRPSSERPAPSSSSSPAPGRAARRTRAPGRAERGASGRSGTERSTLRSRRKLAAGAAGIVVVAAGSPRSSAGRHAHPRRARGRALPAAARRRHGQPLPLRRRRGAAARTTPAALRRARGATLALAVRLAARREVTALPRTLAVPAAAFVGFACLSLLWSRDVEAGTSVLVFFLLPFTALVASSAARRSPPGSRACSRSSRSHSPPLFAVVGLYQAATQQLLFFAPNLEVANTYAPIFRVTSLFRDPSLYGRHVVLGIASSSSRSGSAASHRPAVALIALLWAGLYFSYSQSSLAALFVVVLAIARSPETEACAPAVAVAPVSSSSRACVVVAEVADTSLRRATSDRSRRVELTARVVRRAIRSSASASARSRSRARRSRTASARSPLRLAHDAADGRRRARRDRPGALSRPARREPHDDRSRARRDQALGLDSRGDAARAVRPLALLQRLLRGPDHLARTRRRRRLPPLA